MKIKDVQTFMVNMITNIYQIFSKDPMKVVNDGFDWILSGSARLWGKAILPYSISKAIIHALTLCHKNNFTIKIKALFKTILHLK